MTPEERKIKVRQRSKKWRLDNRDRSYKLDADKHLRRRYGMTPEDYQAISLKQNHNCALCKKPETIKFNKANKISRLAVDHDHKSNQIRGLLCFRCNTMLANIERNPGILESIKTYLGDNNV